MQVITATFPGSRGDTITTLDPRQVFYKTLRSSERFAVLVNERQVSEFAKEVTALDLADYIARKNVNLKTSRLVLYHASKLGLGDFHLLKYNDLRNTKFELVFESAVGSVTYEYVADTKRSGKQRDIVAEIAAAAEAAKAAEVAAASETADKATKPAPVTPASTSGGKKRASRPKPDPKKQKYIDDQVAIAERIWGEVRASYKSEEFLKLTMEERLTLFRSYYNGFYRSHPLAIRYMIELQQFKAPAFQKYMARVVETKPGDPDEWIARQADYDRFLFCNKSTPKSAVADRLKKVFENLKNETDTFKDMQDVADKVAQQLESRSTNDKKRELEEQIELLRESPEAANIENVIYKTNRDRTIELIQKRIAAGEAPYSDDEDELPDFSDLPGSQVSV